MNRDGWFAGQLKFFTFKDKWRKAEKKAEDIVKDGKEKWIKLWQNRDTGEAPAALFGSFWHNQSD